MTVIAAIVSFLSGALLTYLGFRFQLIQGNVNAQRERLLGNIAKIEQFLSLLLEFEYIDYEIVRLKDEAAKRRYYQPQEILDLFNRKFNENKEELGKYTGQPLKQLAILEKFIGELNVNDVALNYHDEDKVEVKFTVNSDAKEHKEQLEALKKELDSLHKQYIVSDIGATCRIVDPSGELLKYVSELMTAGKSEPNKPSKSGFQYRRLELRYKISKLLDQKIN